MDLVDEDKKSQLVQESSEDVHPPRSKAQVLLDRVTYVLTKWGIETNGIQPIPQEERTDTRLYQMFFVWFSCNLNVLSFGTGSAGPAFFGLGVRESLIIILIVDLVSCIFPAYFSLFGPKLGMRSMVQARYTWGYYGAMIPSALNVFSMQGFLILDCIIGGQMLASISNGHLNDTLGIVIIGVISLVVTFFGYRVIHWYESIAWIPNVVTFIVMLGVGGKHLVVSGPPAPVSAAMIITFATTVASSVISWCTVTPDYGVYHIPNASKFRVFLYTYLGFFTASIVSHMLGAAFAASALSDPTWETGFDNGNNVGGLVASVLAPAGGFGKFLVVLIALSIPSACAPTMYTFASSLMTVNYYFAKVPRYVPILSLIIVLSLIPVGVVGATRFYATFTDVLSGSIYRVVSDSL
ncbi:uncharacterized protein FIBRA_03255 [Fibroporia radiculosa]|uniref:Purine-cytosine permease n=1 Tax=Fibroporia radiculosa TaxID=599839 RepID=J4HVW2_9APHY|nr:uncharacterized protein FIBRA_03255 [Fibroporia radiculosa]CCM01207.1 predicted protein [Fibroporia radiculosa]